MSQLLELLAEHKRKSERPITRKKASIQDDKKRASREGKTAPRAGKVSIQNLGNDNKSLERGLGRACEKIVGKSLNREHQE